MNLNYIYLKFFVEFFLRGYLFIILSLLWGKEMWILYKIMFCLFWVVYNCIVVFGEEYMV